MVAGDWINLAVAGVLGGLAVDRWVHGRESTDQKMGQDISGVVEEVKRIESKVDTELGRLWAEVSRMHDKASDMASEWNKKGGELSIQGAMHEADLRSLKVQISDLQRAISDFHAMFNRRFPYNPTS